MYYNFFPKIAGRILPNVVSRGRAGMVYLTFDDGPDRDITPRILEIMEKQDCKCTFFLSYERILEQQNIVSMASNMGHSIGSHGSRHVSLAFSPYSFIKEQFDSALELINQITGNTVNMIRPPYGKFGKSLYHYAKHNELKIILWSYSPADWSIKSSKSISDLISENVRSGDIILLHDHGRNAHNTVLALDGIIDGIRGKGFKLAAL